MSHLTQNPKDHISFINNGWEPKYLKTRNIYVLITELDYSWKGNTAFCYITNTQIVENENASITWSILGINSYDAIYSNSLVLFAC